MEKEALYLIHGEDYLRHVEEKLELFWMANILMCYIKNRADEDNYTMEAALDGMSHLMQQWDEEMIRQLVHTVKVISADHIKVFLCNGIEIDQTVNP